MIDSLELGGVTERGHFVHVLLRFLQHPLPALLNEDPVLNRLLEDAVLRLQLIRSLSQTPVPKAPQLHPKS